MLDLTGRSLKVKFFLKKDPADKATGEEPKVAPLNYFHN